MLMYRYTAREKVHLRGNLRDLKIVVQLPKVPTVLLLEYNEAVLVFRAYLCVRFAR